MDEREDITYGISPGVSPCSVSPLSLTPRSVMSSDGSTTKVCQRGVEGGWGSVCLAFYVCVRVL